MKTIWTINGGALKAAASPKLIRLCCLEHIWRARIRTSADALAKHGLEIEKGICTWTVVLLLMISNVQVIFFRLEMKELISQLINYSFSLACIWVKQVNPNTTWLERGWVSVEMFIWNDTTELDNMLTRIITPILRIWSITSREFQYVIDVGCMLSGDDWKTDGPKQRQIQYCSNLAF